jgi:hypothetical protein
VETAHRKESLDRIVINIEFLLALPYKLQYFKRSFYSKLFPGLQGITRCSLLIVCDAHFHSMTSLNQKQGNKYVENVRAEKDVEMCCVLHDLHIRQSYLSII